MDSQLKIGIVEDNLDLLESLVEVLVALGHMVTGYSSAEDMSDAVPFENFELMILDLNLPGEDGLSLASRLKRVQPSLRVIMMTTRTALDDRVRGYDVGADLYLPKPVAEDELIAAVRALGRSIRANSDKRADDDAMRLRLDSQAMLLSGPNGATTLNLVDVMLLSALARAPGQRLEYWQLIAATGMGVDDAGKANLAVRMSRLRGKLSQLGFTGDVLRAMRGSGYQLFVPMEIR
jgi:DNA-binding response OmpR family regulator